jgi:16S rRNA (cytosine1402-N4)-methyltransferase
MYSHVPVLLTEALHALEVGEDKKYIDCTLGGGGYARAIAAHGGRVLGLDVDQDALTHFTSTEYSSCITVVRSNFERVYDVAQVYDFLNCAGVVFDLGVSSYQIDVPQKGFSFQKEGPLDMRMDMTLGITAGKLLDVLDEQSLADLFIKFGDEIHAHKIARAIVAERKKTSYWEHKNTLDLASLIEKTVGGRRERIHPATRVFQSLRMAVNDEIGALHRGLEGAFDALGLNGRLVVVSFHSVEDRVVKQFMKVVVDTGHGRIHGDFISPSMTELEKNPRSRSAKLRVVEKVA